MTMAAHHIRSCRARALAVTLACAGVLLGTPALASAQSAQSLYERAQSREAAARDLPAPALSELRSAARSYENIVRTYWRSGYCDNALWQAAGLMALAFERSGETSDRDRAERYLEWLRDEYPHSSFVEDVEDRLRALTAPTPAPPDTSTPAQVRSVTHTALPRGDRVTIELTREVPYSGDRVDGPDRLFFDFADSQPASVLERLAAALDGKLIDDVRIGRHPNSVTRVVFELAGAPKHSAFVLYEPFRLVIDLESDTLESDALESDAAAADTTVPADTISASPPPTATPPADPQVDTQIAPPTDPQVDPQIDLPTEEPPGAGRTP